MVKILVGKTFGCEISEGEKFGGDQSLDGHFLVVKSTIVTVFGSAKFGGEIHHTR